MRKLLLALLVMSLGACQNREAEAARNAVAASQLLQQNRIAEARMAINSAIISRDDVAEYHIMRGRIELAAGAFLSAFDAYQDALALDASNAEALSAVSQLGLQTGNLRPSLEATEALLVLNPNNATALLVRGLHALFSSRREEAEGYADRALALNPFSEEATILKARVLYQQGKKQAAINQLDNLTSSRQDSPSLDRFRLEIFRAERDAQGLEMQFERLRKAEPDNLELRLDEANFLFKISQAIRARQITVALLSNPKVTENLVRDVIGLWSEYSVDSMSDKEIRKVSEHGPKFAKLSAARYFLKINKPDLARQLVRRLSGNDQAVISAAIAMRAGQANIAYQIATEIISEDPDNCHALSVRANARSQRGEIRPALRDAQRAAAQCPNETEARVRAAIAYTTLGDIVNARREWLQGSETNPQDPIYAAKYVGWLIEQDRNREAIAVTRRFTHDTPASLRGWHLYHDVCAKYNDPCLEEANRGLENARTSYWIDYEPGEAPPISLFSRLDQV